MKLLFTILLLLTVIFSSSCVYFNIDITPSEKGAHEESITLDWDNSLNRRQSLNACASYSVMAYFYGSSQRVTDPEEINRTITYKMDNNMTYPWGLTKYLRESDLKVSSHPLFLIDEEERKEWIKKKLSKNQPVILLVKDYNALHYITVLGYTGDEFHIYDSMMDKTGTNKTIDTNGALPGNRNLSYEKLYPLWEKALIKGKALFVAITE